jgi:hypothetical protein
MEDGNRKKRYPRDFATQTVEDNNGYPIYRRRDNGAFVEKQNVRLDNR